MCGLPLHQVSIRSLDCGPRKIMKLSFSPFRDYEVGRNDIEIKMNQSFIIFLLKHLLCVCLNVYMVSIKSRNMYTCPCDCAKARGGCEVLCSPSFYCIPLRQDLSLNLEHGWWPASSHSTGLQVYVGIPDLLYECWGFELGSSFLST